MVHCRHTALRGVCGSVYWHFFVLTVVFEITIIVLGVLNSTLILPVASWWLCGSLLRLESIAWIKLQVDVRSTYLPF